MNKIILSHYERLDYLLLIEEIFKNMKINSNQKICTNKMPYVIYYKLIHLLTASIYFHVLGSPNHLHKIMNKITLLSQIIISIFKL